MQVVCAWFSAVLLACVVLVWVKPDIFFSVLASTVPVLVCLFEYMLICFDCKEGGKEQCISACA